MSVVMISLVPNHARKSAGRVIQTMPPTMPAMSTAGIASADEDVPTAIPTPEANMPPTKS